MPKRVLITGGGKRIGAALVKAFAENDWQVFIHVNNSVCEAEKLVAELKNPALHTITRCDFNDPAARKEWLQTLPEFDLVIANASCYRLTRRGEAESWENRQRYRQVNYLSTLELIDFQVNNLPENLPASLIVLLDCDVLKSDGGIKEFVEPIPGVDSYLASRTALANELPELARKYAPKLRINAIAPGPVLPPVDCATKGMTVILERVPMHQPVGVSEIVNTALYLAENPSLTGAVIPVDGGMHLNQKTVLI